MKMLKERDNIKACLDLWPFAVPTMAYFPEGESIF